MKIARRRLDVNLDELDRVLDGARQAPLSEDDHDKLKGALHALVAMLAPSRNSEKTGTVLEKPEESQTSGGVLPDANAPQGHGAMEPRRSAERGRSPLRTRSCITGSAARIAKRAMYTGRRSRRCWCG